MLVNTKLRKEVDESVSCLMTLLFPEKKHAMCLVWAYHTALYIEKMGINTKVALGGVEWRFLDPKLDTGEGATHFGYGYNPPLEYHAWVVYKVEGRHAVVDLTTRFQADRAKQLIGVDWTFTPLPEFLWIEPTDPSSNIFHGYYKIHRLASVQKVETVLMRNFV